MNIKTTFNSYTEKVTMLLFLAQLYPPSKGFSLLFVNKELTF